MIKWDLSEGKWKYKPATRIFFKIQTGLAVIALIAVESRGSTYLLLCWLIFTAESS